MAERHASRTCPLCEATCGVTLTLDGDTPLAVRGDAADPFSRGYLCPKATALAEDKARRRLLRHGLRQMIRERPLGQADRFVKAFYAKVEEVARA